MAITLREACSPVAAASTSPYTTPSEPNQPGSAKQTSIAEPFSNATGPVFRSCPTCGKSTQESDTSTCCTADIPASRSASPASVREKTIRGICGPSSRDSFAYYDPERSCWRTSQATLLSDSAGSSLTLPRWGTTVGGDAFELPTPELRTDASGFSSLLPTPTANDMTGAEGPTRVARRGEGTTGGPSLRDLSHLLPTPRAARGASQTETVRMLPTPTSMDSHASGGSDPSNVTLTDAVVRTSLGARTNPRFDGGNTPSDEPHPGQLTIEDA